MVYAWVLEGEKIRKKGKTKILFKEVVAKNREIGYKCPLLWSNQLESSDLGILYKWIFFSSIEKINMCCVVFLRSTLGGKYTH